MDMGMPPTFIRNNNLKIDTWHKNLAHFDKVQ